MRRFFLKLILFPLPLAVLFAFPIWVFWASGEWLSADHLARRQHQAQPVLIEPAYSDQLGYVKLKAAQETKPEIIALGTSRVMQFRADFFNRSFYNAGIGGLRFWDYQAFVERLDPAAAPKLLILGLDQKHFNPNFIVQTIDQFKKPDEHSNWPSLLGTWDKIYLDWFKGKFKISDLTTRGTDGIERIGLSAKVHNSGYRNDGSHIWHWWEAHDKDLRLIAQNKESYIRADSLYEKHLAELDAFLSLCKQHGITAAGFLPPFSPPVYHALEKERKEFAYVFGSAERLKPIFERYGFPFEDFTDPAAAHIEKDGFHDGEHASEKAYRRLWAVWTEREPSLRTYAK